MTLLIIFVLLALGVSFVCSVLEAVLLSVTPSYCALLEQQKKPIAARLKKLKQEIDRPLVAILTLNTIAHTVGAAGAGAQAAHVFGDEWIGVFSGVLTLLILIASEIIPKTIGAVYWRQLAGPVARTLIVIIYMLYPLVIAMEALTKLLSRGRKRTGISREEMSALAELGAKQGTLDEGESKILRNLFRFGSLCAKDVMTPRTVLFALPKSTTIKEVLDDHEQLVFSRLPVFEGNLDRISGYVLKDHLLLAAAKDNHDMEVGELERTIRVVPQTMPLPSVFEEMIHSREHIALVVDEFGGTAGIVTLEDIVETLLGLEIVDEVDSVEDMQAFARQAWTSRAEQLGLVGKTAGEDGEAEQGDPDGQVVER